MPSIPDDVRRFILTSIPSVPYLEAALLFRGQPSEQRSARDLARALYLPERAGAELLARLCAAGILQCTPDEPALYRYEPGDPTLARALDQLAAAYADDLVGVTNLIHDATRKNATRFADAFKLRKDS